MLTLQDLLRTRTAQPQLNKAMYFNGVNAYILLSKAPYAYLKNPFTWIVWALVYPMTTDIEYIMEQNRTKENFNYEAILQLYYGKVHYWEFDTAYGLYLVGNTRVDDAKWHQIAFVRTATGGAIYVDGKLDVSTIGRVAEIRNDYVLAIGVDYRDWFIISKPRWFYGYIAQILIYRDKALTQNEIQHNMLNPNNPIRENLILWYDARACDASKNICWDLSGNGNHGTMYNVQIVTLSNPVRVGGRL